MATAPRKGLNPSRKTGSSENNKGLIPYPIANMYNTSIGLGDPVALSAGMIVKATNGADAIGVFQGVSYKDAFGLPVWKQAWVAGTNASDIEASIVDDPLATMAALCNSEIPLAAPGQIYAMSLPTPNIPTGRSLAMVLTGVEKVGDVDLSLVTDLGEDVTGLDDDDAFTIRTSQTVTATTITIEDGDGPADLVDKLNAVDNIEAEINSSGFLVIRATDGYNLVVAESVGTPFADLFAGTAGTFAATVAANAGMVKVLSVLDRLNKVVEVVLVNHSLRDDG